MRSGLHEKEKSLFVNQLVEKKGAGSQSKRKHVRFHPFRVKR